VGGEGEVKLRRPGLEADNSPTYETKYLMENGLEIPPSLPHIFTVWYLIQYEKYTLTKVAQSLQ